MSISKMISQFNGFFISFVFTIAKMNPLLSLTLFVPRLGKAKNAEPNRGHQDNRHPIGDVPCDDGAAGICHEDSLHLYNKDASNYLGTGPSNPLTR